MKSDLHKRCCSVSWTSPFGAIVRLEASRRGVGSDGGHCFAVQRDKSEHMFCYASMEAFGFQAEWTIVRMA